MMFRFKRLMALCLACLLAAPTVLAAETTEPEISDQEITAPADPGQELEVSGDELSPVDQWVPRTFVGISNWAKAEVNRADKLGLVFLSPDQDVSLPILRGGFAHESAGLAAKVFDQDLSLWCMAANFRHQMKNGRVDHANPVLLANQLGILQGRGGENLDENADITRQEAAVMLARVYRLYGPEVTNVAPTTYVDQNQVDDWAVADVALMARLGIMQGNEDGTFEPLGKYTVEQCIVTALRLYEKTAQGEEIVQADPMALTAQETVVAQNWNETYTLTASARKGDVFLYAWQQSGLPHGDAISGVAMVDGQNQYQAFPVIIQTRDSGGLSSGRDAVVEKLELSANGKTLLYTVTLAEDVYDMQDGLPTDKVLFKQGVYKVSVKLATGAQTYSRSKLPNG